MKDKGKKYKTANENPLYWMFCIGGFIFGIFSSYLSINFAFGVVGLGFGMMIYMLLNINDKLIRILDEK